MNGKIRNTCVAMLLSAAVLTPLSAVTMHKSASYSSGKYNVDGGVMEIIAYNSTNNHAYSVNGQSGVLAALDLSVLGGNGSCVILSGEDIDIKSLVENEDPSFNYGDMTSVAVSPDGNYLALALQAVTLLTKLGYPVSRENIYEGFRKTHWRGRFTLISKEPVVIMDGAHNPGAARELEHSLKLYFPHRHIRYIFGIFQDKDYKQVIQITAPLADHIITVQTPDNPRALPAEELKEAVACVNPSVEAAKSIEQAVEKTLEEAKPEDVVIIFGSLSFLGEAERNVKKWKEKQDGLQ